MRFTCNDAGASLHEWGSGLVERVADLKLVFRIKLANLLT